MHLANRSGSHRLIAELGKDLDRRLAQFSTDGGEGDVSRIGPNVGLQSRKLIRDVPTDEVASRAEHLAEFDISGPQLGHGHADTLGARVVGELVAIAADNEFLWQLKTSARKPLREAILRQDAHDLADAARVAGELFGDQGHRRNLDLRFLR